MASFMLSFSCRNANAVAPEAAAPPAAPVPTLGAALAVVVAGFREDVVEVLADAGAIGAGAETPAPFLRATASYS